jgi:hypothetical protein
VPSSPRTSRTSCVWTRSTRAAARQQILVSTKTFPQDRSFIGAVVDALGRLLVVPGGIGPDRVVFLSR